MAPRAKSIKCSKTKLTIKKQKSQQCKNIGPVYLFGFDCWLILKVSLTSIFYTFFFDIW